MTSKEHNPTRISAWAGMVVLSLLTACGGGGGDDAGFTGDAGNGDLTEEAAQAESIQIFSDEIEIAANGSDRANLEVLVKDAGNRTLEGVPVRMTVDPDGSGGDPGYNLIVNGEETDAAGLLTATLGSTQELLGGNALVTARVEGRSDLEATLGLRFIGPSLSVTPTSLSLTQGD
ncbi:MAG: hypothetical protein ACLFMW_10385, partial [Ectothiorhodospira sp.]